MARRSDINWDAVRTDVALGTLSIRQIARKHQISDSNLRAKAQREGWPRGDGEMVRAATKEALAAVASARAREIGAEIGEEQAHRYQASLRDATLSAVETATEHQILARRAMNVAADLLRELEITARAQCLISAEIECCRADNPQRAALFEKLLGTKARVEVLDRWAGAASKLAVMERDAAEARGGTKRESVDDLLLRITHERKLLNP